MTLRTAVEGALLIIELHRPDQLNAFTAAMHDELLDAFDRADRDDDVRAVVVTGAGRAFCAGADLSGGGFVDLDAVDPETYRDSGGEVALRIFASDKPVVAAINGAAVGVGASMTLPMDARMLSSEARIGFPFCRRGIAPDACSSWFLPRLVGVPTALDWSISGRLVAAQEAQLAGFAQAVHPPGALLDAACGAARALVEHSAPVSVALTRRMVWSMLGASRPHEAHLVDSRATLARFRSADAAEGVAAFLAKREASFPDRVSSGLPDVGLT